MQSLDAAAAQAFRDDSTAEFRKADAQKIRAVRRGLPDHIDIAVDVTEKCDLPRAKWLANECAAHNILWLEEPLPAHDFDGFAALARNSPVPIATGEHLQGQLEFAPYLKAGLMAVAQPDLAMMGGLTECLRTAQLPKRATSPYLHIFCQRCSSISPPHAPTSACWNTFRC